MRLFGTIDNIISNSEKVNIVSPPFNLLTGSCNILGVAKLTGTGRTQSSANLKAVAKVTALAKSVWKPTAALSSQSKIIAVAKNLKSTTATIKSSSVVTAVSKINRPSSPSIKAIATTTSVAKYFIRQSSVIASRSVVIAPAKIVRTDTASIFAITTTTARGKMTCKGVSTLQGVAAIAVSAKNTIQSTGLITGKSAVIANSIVGVFANIKSISAKVTATDQMTWGAVASLTAKNIVTATAQVSRLATASITSISKVIAPSRVVKTGIIPKITATTVVTSVAKNNIKVNSVVHAISWLTIATSNNNWLAVANLTGTSKIVAPVNVNRPTNPASLTSICSITANAKRAVSLIGSIQTNNSITATCRYFIRNPGSAIKANSKFASHADPSGRVTIVSKPVVVVWSKIIRYGVLPVLSVNARTILSAKTIWKAIAAPKGNALITASAKNAIQATASITINSTVVATGRAGYTFSTARVVSKVTAAGQAAWGTNVSIVGNSTVSASAQITNAATVNIVTNLEMTPIGRVNVSIAGGVTSNSSVTGMELVASVYAILACKCKLGALVGSYAYANLTANCSVSVSGNRFLARRSITDGTQTFCNPCSSFAFTFKRDGQRHIKNIVRGALAPTLHHLGVSHDVSD